VSNVAQPNPTPQLATLPSQTYYPRAAIHLVVRFDEYGNVKLLRQAAVQTTTKNLNGTQTNRSGLVAQQDPTAPQGVTRYVLAPKGQTPSIGNGPQNNTQSSDDLTWDVMCIPDSLTWSQNGLRKAATLKATLRYIDLPFDPRLARQVAVELLLGCVDYETAALEATGQWQGQDAPIIPRTYVGPYGEPRTNVRFLGWIDSWESMWSGDKEPLVDIECSDNTQLLIDQDAPPRLVLDMTKTLDLAVANYLANFVQYAGLTVQYLPSSDTAPVLGKILSNTAFRPNLGPQPSKGGSGTATTKTSVLDYLTEVCMTAGHTVRVVGTNVIIQRVRSILTNSTTPRPTDPFQPRTVAGRSYPNRVFIFGSNLDEMRIKREFRRHPAANVEARCYVAEKKTVLVARYPRVSSQVSSQQSQIRALPGNTQPDQKWVVIEVAGIKDTPTLNKVAQEYYEQIGRQELGVTWKTANLSSFGGGNTDPDVLDMQFGDTFEFFVDRQQASGSTLNNIETFLTASQKAQQFMQQLGFADDFAKAYAQAYTDANFQYAFRMHTMTVHWSNDEGCTLSGTGVNYVEVRAGPQAGIVLPPGQEPGNTALQPQQPPPEPG
jgi:hypothetical protein